MSEFLSFIWAVVEQWAVLVTGGVLTAIIMVLQYYWQKTLSWRVYRWVITFFAVFACFLAWREEYRRAENALIENARLEGQRREDSTQTIQALQEANKRLEEQVNSTQKELLTLRSSGQPRRLSPDERAKFTAVLASYDGRQFGSIDVRTYPACHECLVYVNDIVNAINSIPGWSAEGTANYLVKVDFAGIGIGVKDPKSPPRGAQIVADALKAADLQFTIETLDSVFTMETLETASPDIFMLVIGSKR